MDEIIGFVIIVIIAGLLQRVFGAQKGKAQQQQRPPEGEWGTEEGAGEAEARPISLQELIAEQLGLNLERKPSVRRLPETPSEEPYAEVPGPPPVRGPAAGPPSVRGRQPAAAPRLEREIFYPTPRRPEPERRATTAVERGAEAAEGRRRTGLTRIERAPLRPRVAAEESAAIERRHPDSLERPRRPQDHQRFHKRYGVPEPVSSHEEFHERYVKPARRVRARRSDLLLPDHPEWSAVQKAIIWAEILGRPKGLD